MEAPRLGMQLSIRSWLSGGPWVLHCKAPLRLLHTGCVRVCCPAHSFPLGGLPGEDFGIVRAQAWRIQQRFSTRNQVLWASPSCKRSWEAKQKIYGEKYKHLKVAFKWKSETRKWEFFFPASTIKETRAQVAGNVWRLNSLTLSVKKHKFPERNAQFSLQVFGYLMIQL